MSSATSSSDRSFSVTGTTLPRRASRSRLQKGSKPVVSPSINLIDPWDFAALPPAVRRKQFSPEEQYHIASRLNLVVLDAADEAIYKQYRIRSQSAASYLLDSTREELYEDGSVFEEEIDDMTPEDLESFRWLDEDTDLDLRLDNYHTIHTDIHKGSTTSVNRHSFRRGLSFSNVSFRRRSGSTTSVQSHSVASPTKPTTSASSNASQTQQHAPTSRNSVDTSTQHYQDPAAKMKLRVYLASPQKFDEALEFGFPSLRKDTVQSPARPKTSPGHIKDQGKTFFADDTPSLSGDDSPDEISDYLQQDSPRTPIDLSFPINRSNYRASMDRPYAAQPRLLSNATEIYTHAPASDREMTLRMTLTRPELRALEETDHAKSVAVNDLPLEKAPLTIPFTKTIWDELPEEPSRFKRLFKKFTSSRH